jgi:hypothetical protein
MKTLQLANVESTTSDKDFKKDEKQAYNLSTLYGNFMSTRNYPGVYELLVKRKGINAPVFLCITYVTDSSEGAQLTLNDKKYQVLNRSGLPPTGRLVLKEL